MTKIKVGIVGVGDCCSSLVQGVSSYNDGEFVGLKFENFGGYKPSDIEFTAAFDIDSLKVGKDLSEAIFAKTNRYEKVNEVNPLGVIVQKGEIMDGVGEYLHDQIKVDDKPSVKVSEVLKKSKTEILINFIPTGSVQATKWYAEQAINAGCAFINTTTTEIARSKEWTQRFKEAKLPLAGDDIMDQIGATIIHKALLEFLVRRGVKIDETYQLDIGGGTESLATLEKARGDIKREVKRKTIQESVPYEVPIIAGTTDYVDFMKNTRDSYFWISGKYFNSTPVKMDITLRTVDAPNSTSILLDVIRGLKIAIDRKLYGAIDTLCAYGFKRPPKSYSLIETEKMINEYIEGKRNK
ncbi:MAG: inositol-3-phosphate synthase [Candidatus Jordarchaeum sp.]|uniref:inositol-3-phosphate synthase n=1 Tax=Candidatus Jordarchaeum sp. TaxID=2823881 RepID=UPI00404B6946